MSHVSYNKITDGSEILDRITFDIHVLPKGQQQFMKTVLHFSRKERRPFSKEDFPLLTPANYRKYIQKLRSYIEPVGNTRPRFWKIKGVKLPGDSHRVTLGPTGVGQNFLDILESLKVQKASIHDLKIQFKSDLHFYLLRKGATTHPSNNSIKVDFPIRDNNITVKILVYPQTAQVDIGCTYRPIVYDFNGILYLIELLSKISYYLEGLSSCISIPPVHEWIMTHYHFAKDGPELNGQMFHLAFHEVAGGLIRFYSKRMPDGSKIQRLEQIRTNPQTLTQELQATLEKSA